MAIIEVHEQIPGGSGTGGALGKRRVSRQWRIVSNDQYANPITLSADPLFPVVLFDPHPNALALTARTVDFRRTSAAPSRSEWTALVAYSDEPISTQEKERQEQPDPTLRGLKLEVYSVTYGQLVTTDINDRPMKTSAGEPYPPYEIDDDRWVISGERNYAAGAVPAWAFEYQNKLNDAPITVKGRTLATETCKYSSTKITPIQLENGILFETLRFEIQYRNQGWQAERLDAGFLQRKGLSSATRVEAIVLDDGKRPTTEQLLDGNGRFLKETLGYWPPNPGDEHYNNFDVYGTADFSIISLIEAS